MNVQLQRKPIGEINFARETLDSLRDSLAAELLGFSQIGDSPVSATRIKRGFDRIIDIAHDCPNCTFEIYRDYFYRIIRLITIYFIRNLIGKKILHHPRTRTNERM